MSAADDLAAALDAERAAIEALDAQFAAGFDRLEQRFGGLEETGDVRSDKIEARFAEMCARFDEIGTGMQQTVDLLTRPQDR